MKWYISSEEALSMIIITEYEVAKGASQSDKTWLDLVHDHIWEYSGDTLGYFNNWAPGEPIYAENCTLMSSPFGKWYDNTCLQAHAFICEVEGNTNVFLLLFIAKKHFYTVINKHLSFKSVELE